MFPEQMQQDDDDTQDDNDAGDNGGDEGVKGDGMHHHEIHEDEGGGFHSVHTHPDGHKDQGDHVTYDDAKADMDEKFGHGEPDGDEGDDMSDEGGDDMSLDDVAGSYGRKGAQG